MRLGKATLIKRVTEDGNASIKDDVPLGKTYQVDLDTRKVYDMYNVETHKFHSKEAIYAKDPEGSWSLFVTELLLIEDPAETP